MNVDEAKHFYARQYGWLGDLEGDLLHESHRQNARLVRELLGRPPGRLLELGAGRGENAVAAAEIGFSVTAIEIVPSVVRRAHGLVEQHGINNVTIVEGDFYTVDIEGPFDAVTYWDGFGVCCVPRFVRQFGLVLGTHHELDGAVVLG